MRKLYVIVVQTAGVPDDEEDRGIEGVYAVEVDAALNNAKAASVALDVFHGAVAIGCLDDFEITVTDGEYIIDQDPDHDDYSGKDLGCSLGKVSDQFPCIHPDEDELAEWVGLHYKRIYASETAERKAEWRKRWNELAIQTFFEEMEELSSEGAHISFRSIAVSELFSTNPTETLPICVTGSMIREYAMKRLGRDLSGGEMERVVRALEGSTLNEVLGDVLFNVTASIKEGAAI
jgi:hypothetical protein